VFRAGGLVILLLLLSDLLSVPPLRSRSDLARSDLVISVWTQVHFGNDINTIRTVVGEIRTCPIRVSWDVAATATGCGNTKYPGGERVERSNRVSHGTILLFLTDTVYITQRIPYLWRKMDCSLGADVVHVSVQRSKAISWRIANACLCKT
jgi:hypothetical protein